MDIILLSGSIILFIALLFALFSLITGAPFVPSRDKAVEKMIALADIKPGERAADLGSGNGKVVIALARAGAEAHGYEINPLLIWWSRINIQRAGLETKAFIHWKSFWGENFITFSVISLYGIPHIMKRLEKKLRTELRPGTRVVSNAFTFPHWIHSKKDNDVYLYLFS